MGDATWWQRGVIYQIYPRSFMDSDGDGVGDLPGILARLDHLTWLGVDAIWLSPVHPSPMADFGYDVSDYTGVDPVFGTLADLDELVAAAHARGLRVLLDWVPNHTSDQHPWFQESWASRDNPRRDWYVWRDPRPDGGPPSNWLRYIGDSAWRWDEASGQYYFRVFLDSQPDLNWRNPRVQAAMFDTLRFWLARGVDGFRIDALVVLVEDDQLRDNPPNPHYRPGEDFPYLRELSIWNVDRPETRELAARMRKVADELGDGRVLLAELGPDELAAALPAELARHTELTVATAADLAVVLKQVRSQGWSLVDQELEMGLRSVAAPLRDASGRAVAAMNISTQVARTTVVQLHEELLPDLV
ncbi:MAG TPA: alpha-amylase family glycosyl hydrolase, partial [Actinomycetota bacterium]|nr:alpha-amylase family glycosyl hydrolase [Actinomycetota bacterium]